MSHEKVRAAKSSGLEEVNVHNGLFYFGLATIDYLRVRLPTFITEVHRPE